jgi:predicted RNA binding protein YcfA (HicA-like mRNA interferase family)
MRLKELLQLLFSDGWQVKEQDDRRQLLVHPVKPDKLTLPVNGEELIGPGTLKTILKQAGIS